MNDLIRREDAIEVAYQLRRKPNDDEWDWWLRSFNAIPSADRPQGEWISDYSSPVAYRCTACNTLQHWSVIQNGRYRFCPNCGARMKGVSTDIDCFDTCKHAYSEVCDECYKGNKYNAVKGADDE